LRLLDGCIDEEEIYASGDHIRVTLNGQVIVDAHMEKIVKNNPDILDEHPGLLNKRGHIGFLGHDYPLKFRNIRIKKL
jgi:hypothetical protein